MSTPNSILGFTNIFQIIDTTPPRTDLVHPRGIQRSYVLTLSETVTGQIVSFLIKTNRTDADSEALLIKDNDEHGGITLDNSGLQAFLTIFSTDLDDKKKFESNTPLWYAFKTNSPPDEPVYGTFTIEEQP